MSKDVQGKDVLVSISFKTEDTKHITCAYEKFLLRGGQTPSLTEPARCIHDLLAEVGSCD